MLLPLHNRAGQIVAYATIDECDAHLAQHRWYRDTHGYARRNIRSGSSHTIERMHRAVLGLRPNDGLQADHVNGDRLDNRRSNLRIVTRAQNQQNRTSANRGSASGYRGVSRRGDSWRARARLGGRLVTIGWFRTAEEADRAARAWRAQHMPFSPEARAATNNEEVEQDG